MESAWKKRDYRAAPQELLSFYYSYVVVVEDIWGVREEEWRAWEIID